MLLKAMLEKEKQMRTRRQFLTNAARTMAGMAVSSGEIVKAGATGAQTTQTGARRRAVVGGRRVTTVDVHAHCEIPGVRNMMGG